MNGKAHRRRAIAFVTWAMRAGYATRAVIYAVMGGISLFVGILGGNATGLLGSIRWIGQLPGQAVYLIILAVGMVAYTIWRGGDAVANLAGHNPRRHGLGRPRRAFLHRGALHRLHLVRAARRLQPERRRRHRRHLPERDAQPGRPLVRGRRRVRNAVLRVLFRVQGRDAPLSRAHAHVEHAEFACPRLRLRAGRARDRDRRDGRADHLVGLGIRAAGGRRLRPDAAAHPRGLVRAHHAGHRRHGPARLLGIPLRRGRLARDSAQRPASARSIRR